VRARLGEATELDSSVGRIEVVWGWNRGVSVRTDRGKVVSGLVSRTADLTKLFERAGVLEPEATALAKQAWRRKPRARWQGEASPWNVLDTGWGALVVFGAAALCIVLWALAFGR
jgi:hypothetical protein